MLELLFGFRGAIARRSFLIGNAILFAAIFVVVLVATIVAMGLFSPGNAASIRNLSFMLGALAALAVTWPMVALYVKRLRDFGIGTAPALTLILGLSAISYLLPVVGKTWPPALLAILTGLAALANLALFVAACCIRGRDPVEEEDSPRFDDEPAPMPSGPRPATVSAPQATVHFGRRGL